MISIADKPLNVPFNYCQLTYFMSKKDCGLISINPTCSPCPTQPISLTTMHENNNSNNNSNYNDNDNNNDCQLTVNKLTCPNKTNCVDMANKLKPDLINCWTIRTSQNMSIRRGPGTLHTQLHTYTLTSICKYVWTHVYVVLSNPVKAQLSSYYNKLVWRELGKDFSVYWDDFIKYIVINKFIVIYTKI